MKSMRKGDETSRPSFQLRTLTLGSHDTHPQDLFHVPIKHVRREAAMCPEPLPRQRIPNPKLLFCHEAQMVTFWIHNHISVCLFETDHQIHHLQLSLHDDGGVSQKACRGMSFLEDAMRVFWDVHGGEEVILV